MPSINQLSRADTVTAGDLLVAFITSLGDARAVPVSVLADYIQSIITATDDKVTQYSAPSATAFTVAIDPADESVWLVLTPVADYAAGTIQLPADGDAFDKQEVLVNSTHAITALTVSSTGNTVTGAPTTLAANGFFRMRFEGVTKTWYRVG